MEFRLLGPVEAEHDGRTVGLGPRQQRLVLAVLALEVNQSVAVDRLVELVWPVAPPRTAAHAVRVGVSALRSALAGAGVAADETELVTRGPGYLLRTDPARIDAHRFRALVQQARECAEDAPRAALLDAALGLWRGQVLAGTAPAETAERLCRGLLEARLVAVEDRLDARLRLGHHRDLLDELTGLVDNHPLRERLVGQLMLALYRSGRAGEALAAYRRTARRLAEETGLDPGPDLRRLELSVLRGAPALDLPPGRPSPNLPPGHPAVNLPRTDSALDVPRGGSALGVSRGGSALDVPRGARALDVPRGRNNAAGARRSAQVPHQLPRLTAGFTGRDAQLRELDAVLDRDADTSPVVVLTGTAGVGKTALAVRWAHTVSDRYPDGQLSVNLRGHASGPPLPAAEALARFLRALGTPAEQVPLDAEEAAGLYRTMVAGRRMLVLLDNAADAGQVRPLLAAGPGCLTVITSRDGLGGLVARDGAYRLTLPVLTAAEARALLAGTLGPDRVRAEPDATAELVDLCGRLPLALRIAAANLTGRPGHHIAGYVGDLRDGDRLAALEIAGDEQAAVRAAFDLSYAALEPPARRLFRLLGLVPGTDVTPDAAAALADTTPDEVRHLLDRLTAAHLVEQHAPGRWSGHDLLRLYARDLAHREDTDRHRAAALDRLLGFYLRTVDVAARLLYPHMQRLPFPVDGGGPPPARLDEQAQAVAWLDAERANLVAAVRYAAAHGPRQPAWLLADALRGYFWLRRHGADWLAVAHAGLDAARYDDEPHGQAAAHISIAQAHRSRSEHPAAVEHYTAALALARRAGWPDGEAAALGSLGNVYRDQGLLAEAADHHGQARIVYRRLGVRAGEAVSLGNLGTVDWELGRLAAAADHFTAALALYREIGSTSGQAHTLNGLGNVRHAQGRLDEALDHLHQALALHRESGSREGEADTLSDLGETHCAAGRPAEGLRLADEALALSRAAGDTRIEVDALATLALAHSHLGRHGEAAHRYADSLALAHSTGYRRGEARALAGLATAELALARYPLASSHAQQARDLAGQAGFRVIERQAADVLTALPHT